MTTQPKADPSKQSSCCCGPGCCGASPSSAPAHAPVSAPDALHPRARLHLARREVLRLGVLAGAAAGMWPLDRAIAGPFGTDDGDDFPIPADKKFDPAWIESLFARGSPTVYRSAAGELGYIGMPVGGVCCGQVYLGGDGSLWHWDIFNLPQSVEWSHTGGPLYARPARPASPISQGFALRVSSDAGARTRRLDATGFRDIEFRGQYPIGLVQYSDPDSPVRVQLEAFSPFCPLDENLSGTPAVVMNYTITNTSDHAVDASIAGWLENPVCKQSGRAQAGTRVSRVLRRDVGGVHTAILECSARPPRPDEAATDADRPDIVFEDWERGEYAPWTTTGTAFGDAPRDSSDINPYQGDLNMQGRRTVNTHQTRAGEDVRAADAHIGTLTSPVFTIARRYICFRVGGGNHPAQTCVNLLIDGAVVRTTTGRDSNRMRADHFDVREFEGRQATLQIVDGWTGPWGNIGCDHIVFCDRPIRESLDLALAPDFGSMTLSVLGSGAETVAAPAGADRWTSCFDAAPPVPDDASIESTLSDPPAVGFVRCGPVTLAPGESRTLTFLITWCFPNPDRASLSFLQGSASLRRWYATRFANAEEVRSYVAGSLDELTRVTRLWRDTWYDSTLPFWFLDRTFVNLSTAATATCWRFDNGRFYAWEGTYCCAGTCTHVWQYAQGLARIFPGLERSTRELVDFGLAFRDDSGQIDYRAEAARELAVDGQCGTILRAYREHLMSPDAAFLTTIWPRVRKATELMLARDPDENGILDGPQYNTLDTTWYGKISWLTSLYLAALRAAAAMAREMRDDAFADRCARIADRGSDEMVRQLFNGEYFIHATDPAHPEANSTGRGCHIDQLLGQSWAHQAGLPRIVPLEQSRSALRALYTYSVAPDIGPYRARTETIIKGGRWYAMPGEGGMLMCTWPRGGSESATGASNDAWAAGYFNECMSGFEHQAASHMIAEGLVLEGLAVTRLIHDRYHAARRNPFNEVECSNHYARALASYASFLSACGYDHHGPRGVLAFAPRLTPNDFRCAFTAAGGWGQFRQTSDDASLRVAIDVRWGGVRLSELRLQLPAVRPQAKPPARVSCTLANADVPCTFSADGPAIAVRWSDPISIQAGSTLQIRIDR